MADYFYTDTPKWLLEEFNKRIAQTEPRGKITTWERSDDGIYYTHTSENWRKKAWFKPSVESDRLAFNIIKPKNCNVTTEVAGLVETPFRFL